MDQMDADIWWTVLNRRNGRATRMRGRGSRWLTIPCSRLVIAIAVAGLLFGHDAVTEQVMSSIKDMLGETRSEGH
jgi:membrane protein